MKKEVFYGLLNNIDDNYIQEAKKETRKMIPFRPVKAILAAAACLCIVAASIFTFRLTGSKQPHPEQVQCPSPLMEVESLGEMERYLDFKIPVLEKDVETYIVFVNDSYPASGRIFYTDGSVFTVMYGTGDVSGIYGGELVKTETIDAAEVNFYTYTDMEGVVLSYANWEKDGFTYSLSEESSSFEQLAEDVRALMK